MTLLDRKSLVTLESIIDLAPLFNQVVDAVKNTEKGLADLYRVVDQ